MWESKFQLCEESAGLETWSPDGAQIYYQRSSVKGPTPLKPNTYLAFQLPMWWLIPSTAYTHGQSAHVCIHECHQLVSPWSRNSVSVRHQHLNTVSDMRSLICLIYLLFLKVHQATERCTCSYIEKIYAKYINTSILLNR